ncbi:hypothetical protein Q0Z83_089650 [Actinoplanes sichuanensis]|uniref:DUF1508 domain-containing protein n=1 Tax=Actinoplanes sichuanensis TaxID=512349 RepID=A0ABW4AKK0_9ACTN|nr:hypothetical protein [Actinoplanes sichuanensis]BEL10774.1 hypothetical protein Q0Z83_089650 [Actinoplanes sichuanensis]
MPKPKKPAWKATARTLVLYNPEGQWRFAIYNDAGIIDGGIPDASAKIPPDEAQAWLLANVEEITEQRYVAAWKQNQPHWWSADLTVVS